MRTLLLLAALIQTGALATSQVAVKADTIHTVSGPTITDGVVIITDGKITAVGPAAEIRIPAGHEVLTVAVCVPGLVDIRDNLNTGRPEFRVDVDRERAGAFGLSTVPSTSIAARRFHSLESFGLEIEA